MKATIKNLSKTVLSGLWVMVAGLFVIGFVAALTAVNTAEMPLLFITALAMCCVFVKTNPFTDRSCKEN